MSDQTIYEKEGISRRNFLKGGVGLGVALIAIQSIGTAVVALQGCASTSTGSSSFPDLIITSSLNANHTHKVIIPGGDISGAPAEKTYTSDGATHTHNITLKKADFEAIKNKQTVTVTSTSAGNHTHTFEIKLP